MNEINNLSFLAGVVRMPDNRRSWTEEDIGKLRSLAGRYALREIAMKLGRTPGATAIVASKLKLSLHALLFGRA